MLPPAASEKERNPGPDSGSAGHELSAQELAAIEEEYDEGAATRSVG